MHVITRRIVLNAFTAGPGVRFEPAKSAEPPNSSGNNAPNASMAFCDAFRVAIFSCGLALFDIGIRPSRKIGWEAATHSAQQLRRQLWISRLVSVETILPGSFSIGTSAASIPGIGNVLWNVKGAWDQPSFSRVRAISASPSGGPWHSSLPCLLGAKSDDGFAANECGFRGLFSALLDGRFDRIRIVTIYPGITCHPWDSKRWVVLSVNHPRPRHQ